MRPKIKTKKFLVKVNQLKPSQLIKIEDGLTEATRESEVFEYGSRGF